jgi:DNA/RNA endonuclease G (NUC1)
MKKVLFILLLLQVTAGCFCQVITIRKQYYIIYFHEKQKAPLYTVYVLKKAYITKNKRHGSFQQDTAVSADGQANAAVYKNNDYDQGHLTPDADFRFNATAEAQTFLFTNAAPQESYFNEHLWANVETHARALCKTFGNIKVYTGCLYSNRKLHGIGIPAYFWKVLLYKVNGKIVQEAYRAKNVKPHSNTYTTVTDSMADIKKLTGLVFSY